MQCIIVAVLGCPAKNSHLLLKGDFLSIPPFFIPQGAVPLRLDAWQICYLDALLPGCL